MTSIVGETTTHAGSVFSRRILSSRSELPPLTAESRMFAAHKMDPPRGLLFYFYPVQPISHPRLSIQGKEAWARRAAVVESWRTSAGVKGVFVSGTSKVCTCACGETNGLDP